MCYLHNLYTATLRASWTSGWGAVMVFTMVRLKGGRYVHL